MDQAALLIDSHNFGRSVAAITQNDRRIFQKPRTVFWEWLLFGDTSPLRAIIDNQIKMPEICGGEPISLADPIFGLSISIDDVLRSGSSEEIKANSQNMGSNVFFSFGVLLGYCYAFGVQDLFFQNLVPRGNKVQVIDAEVVFSDLHLPHETLLLPFRETTFKRSGISLLTGSLPIIPEYAKAVIAGFYSILKRLSEVDVSLAEAIDRELINHSPIPIRIILRETKKYYHWKTETFDVPLFPGEIEQLERGDVPYFFTHVSSGTLFYYTTSDWQFREVSLPDHFAKGMKQFGCKPGYLLNSNRLNKRLTPYGVLFLSRILFPESWVGEFQYEDLRLKIGDEISLVLSDESFKASRRSSRQNTGANLLSI